MQNFANSLSELFSSFKTSLASVTVKDIIDIALVTIVLFLAFRFIKDRRAGRLLAGVFVLAVIKLLCDFFEISAMSYILKLVFENGLLAIVILFQPELRSMLEVVGGEPLKNLNKFGGT